MEQARLDTLKKGITIDGVKYNAINATIDSVQGSNTWMTVSLSEGKNREIRKVMEHLGLQVNRLIRLSYGPFQLGHLADGMVEEIPTKALREQIPEFFKKK
jgi:23S rRNA pseudouridine2605 synthase